MPIIIEEEMEGNLSTPARIGLVIIMILLVAVFAAIEKTIAPVHERTQEEAPYSRYLAPFDEPSPPERALMPIAQPAAATLNPEERTSPGGERRYEVKRGDSLERIAFEFLGSASEWRKLADANRISDPTRLRIGQTIVIPAR